MDAYRLSVCRENSLLLAKNSLFLKIFSLLVCVGNCSRTGCSTGVFRIKIGSQSPRIAKFPVKFPGNASRAISPAASTCSRRQIEGVAPGRSDLVRAIARIALSRPSLQRILRVIERHADIGAALHVDQPAKAAAMRGVGPVLAALDYGFTKDRRVTHRRRTRSPCRRSLQSGSASTPPRD